MSIQPPNHTMNLGDTKLDLVDLKMKLTFVNEIKFKWNKFFMLKKVKLFGAVNGMHSGQLFRFNA